VPIPVQGRIVEALVLDPQSSNPKNRPVVIVTPTHEIVAGRPFVAIAITSQVPNNPSENYVLLPYQRNGRGRSGLRKKCAAMCDWAMELRHEDIVRYIGWAPTDKVTEITNYIAGHPDY